MSEDARCEPGACDYDMEGPDGVCRSCLRSRNGVPMYACGPREDPLAPWEVTPTYGPLGASVRDLVRERDELDRRRDAVRQQLGSRGVGSLPPGEYELLRGQYFAMQAYGSILCERIRRRSAAAKHGPDNPGLEEPS